jgi:hypothetical protein
MNPAPAHRLLQRLDAIGAALGAREGALALIGLGSAGLEQDRLDEWSDLDFLVLVAPGHKARFLERLDWLEAAAPLAWQHRHSGDGHKALMTDGVFCDFSVFEPQELDAIPFAPGRVVWRRDGVDPAIATPRLALPRRNTDEQWIVGDALACLLLGLARWRRGERLAALRLVQGQALERLIELDALRVRPPGGDPFDVERRLESRQPQLARELPTLAPGYGQTPQAALALLDALQRRGALLAAPMVERIRALAGAG